MPTSFTKHAYLFGAMLWIQPDAADEQISADMRSMLDTGLSLARVFITGDSIEPEPDKFDFSLWDRVFRLAETHGMFLAPTLSAFGCPSWVRKLCGDELPSLERYHFIRSRVLKRIEKTVTRYKDSHALHSWILQNEPRLDIELNAATIELFRDWLPEHYNYDLTAIRQAYEAGNPLQLVRPKTRFTSSHGKTAGFAIEYGMIRDSIGEVFSDGSARIPGVNSSGWVYAGRVDWAQFNAWLAETQLREANEVVKLADPNHMTSINPDGLGYESPAEGGRNFHRLGRIVDFLGCSCHPSWHSDRFPVSRVDDSVAMFCDMTRSMTADPDGYYWITELQAGPNFYSGTRPMTPTGDDIRHWLWQAIGAGCRGFVYWLFKARDAGYEGMEWGLMNIKGRPSPRSETSLEVSRFLKLHELVFRDTRPKAFDGYILHSYDSIVLSAAEHQHAQKRAVNVLDPRNGAMLRDALCGAYLMMRDLGRDVGFTEEHHIPLDAPFLIAPNLYGLSEDVLETLLAYVEGGGVLIADGRFALKDPYGFSQSPCAERIVDKIFGSSPDDYSVDLHDIFMTLNSGTSIPAWYLTCQWDEPVGEVLARDREGRISAIVHRSGRGSAIWIGTLFFQQYFAKDISRESVSFIEDFLPKRSGYFLTNHQAGLRLRVLDGHPDVLIILNRGQKWIGSVDGCDALFDLDSAVTVPAHNIHVNTNQVRVFTVL